MISQSTKATFDGLDRMTSYQPPVGAGDATAYDPAGNVKSQTVAGITTKFNYDPDNEQTTAIDAKNGVSTNVFGVMGEVKASYDPNNIGVFSGYDLDFRQIASSLMTGAVTQFTLNPAGDTIAEKDPDNNLTTFQLDKNANTVATVDPLGNKSTQTFDGVNNPVTSVDRDGRKITNTYDPGNRLSSQLWIAANGAQADSLAFTYDKNDNTLTAANSNGGYTFTPDPANFVTSQTDPFGKTLTFTPDADYNVVQVADSAGGTQTNVFDTADRLTSRQFVAGSNQARIDIAYTPASEISTLTRYSDTAGTQLVGTTQDSYDAVGNITEMKHKNASGTVLEDFTYNIDLGSRVTSETDTISGTATTTGYGYDNANQLTSAGTATFGFDLNGNRNSGSFQVGPNNQLLSDGSWNYKYDPEENLVEKDGIGGNAGLKWVYTYNNANEMTSATETNGTTQVVQETNLFDVFQNMVEQDISQNGGQPVKTMFARQVVNLAGSASGTGNLAPTWADLNSSNQVTTRRIWALDQVFARIGSTGTVEDYFTDRLGSIRGLMNPSTGALDDAITFDATGNKTSESNPSNGDRMGYAGGQFDPYLLADNFDNRWYTPADGTWLSQDPLGLGPDSNPYRYVGNGPVNGTDPSGMQRSRGAGLPLQPPRPGPGATLDDWRQYVWDTQWRARQMAQQQGGPAFEQLIEMVDRTALAAWSAQGTNSSRQPDELTLALGRGAFGLRIYGLEQQTTQEAFGEVTNLLHQFPAHVLALGVTLVLSAGEGKLFDMFLRFTGRIAGATYRFVRGKFVKLVNGRAVRTTEEEARRLLDAFRADRHRLGIPQSGKLNAPNATDPQLRRTYAQLWRPQDASRGGTISELLREAASGGPLTHLQKAKERLASLVTRVRDFSRPLSQADRAGAERVIGDLREAIRIAEGR